MPVFLLPPSPYLGALDHNGGSTRAGRVVALLSNVAKLVFCRFEAAQEQDAQ